MKTFLIACLALLTTAASASEIRIASISQYDLWGSASVSQEFGYNPEMGRAWVEVAISSGDPDGGMPSVERYKVEGLSFDELSKSIVIDHEGKITTCATIRTRGRGIFRTTRVVMTSDCEFLGRWRHIVYDDGFEMRKTSRYEVFLSVK